MKLNIFDLHIILDYKMINAAELIHIYLIHGYVLLASKVACEYIEAVQGNGKEYFGLKTALHTTSPPVWLPFNLFDQLLLELKEHSDEPIYQKVLMPKVYIFALLFTFLWSLIKGLGTIFT